MTAAMLYDVVLHEEDPPARLRPGRFAQKAAPALLDTCVEAQHLVRNAIERLPNFRDVADQWEQASHVWGMARLRQRLFDAVDIRSP